MISPYFFFFCAWGIQYEKVEISNMRKESYGLKWTVKLLWRRVDGIVEFVAKDYPTLLLLDLNLVYEKKKLCLDMNKNLDFFEKLYLNMLLLLLFFLI